MYARVWTGLAGYAEHGVVDGENQSDCPCGDTSDSVIGNAGNIRSLVTVDGGRNGWYQIDYNGEFAWVRGWFTASRQ